MVYSRIWTDLDILEWIHTPQSISNIHVSIHFGSRSISNHISKKPTTTKALPVISNKGISNKGISNDYLQPPEFYLEKLLYVRKKNISSRSRPLKIEKRTNTYPEINGRLWGTYEITPIGVGAGCWNVNGRDDLKEIDIDLWNRLAEEVSNVKVSV